nr:unnamed protein product [Bacillus sp.] [Bacillus sp. (in: firmicutes)]
MNDIWKTRSQPRIGIKKLLHFLTISSENHDEFIPVILHPFHECIDCFNSKGVMIIPRQRVRFINKKYPAKCRFNNIICKSSCLSDIFTD